VFLNQRAAEFSFFTPSAPHRPIHSNLSGVDGMVRRYLRVADHTPRIVGSAATVKSALSNVRVSG
jgi:hypothetical protein